MDMNNTTQDKQTEEANMTNSTKFEVVLRNKEKRIISNDSMQWDEDFMRDMPKYGCLAHGNHGKINCPLCIVSISKIKELA